MQKIHALLFLSFLLFFSACNFDSAKDPNDVLSFFLEALRKKDINEAKKYVTEDSEGMLGMIEMGGENVSDIEDFIDIKKENIRMGEAVITGDKATIPVMDKTSNEETDFFLKKENGSWKVAFDRSTLMEMAQKKMKGNGLKNSAQFTDSLPPAPPETADSADKQKMKIMLDSAENILEKMQKNVK